MFKSKKAKILAIIILAAAAAVLFFWNDLSVLYSKLSLRLPQIEQGVGNLVQETGKQIFTPTPLTGGNDSQVGFLTKEGVIEATNEQRIQNGLPPLKENPDLDASAAAKVQDMFKNQYFAHESPSGVGVADLAQQAGYQFIVIGENLAMGNFTDDQALVSAWMASPGHRANILNSSYQDIGVAVLEGTYQGHTTWMAVQHFGEPLSACPQPQASLKSQIDSNETQISEMQTEMQSLQQKIQSMQPRNRQQYNQEIDQYNQLVNQYNALVSQTKDLISQYNAQVNSFNACVGGS